MNEVLDRKIDVAERLILNPYRNKLVTNKINVLAAPTGVGKTYNIGHNLLPYDLELGIKKFIFLTPYKDSVEQDYNDLLHAVDELGMNVQITQDIDEFLNWDMKRPVLLISTLAGAANGGSEVEKNAERLVSCLQGEEFSVWWDEMHYSASSSWMTTIFNTGQTQRNYTGTYFNLLWDLSQIGGKVVGFTATPVVEQLGELDTNYYHLATDMGLWPSQNEISYVSSQCRGISKYDLNHENYVDALETGIAEYFNFSNHLKSLANKISKYEPSIKFHTKGILQIISSVSNATESSGLNLHLTLENVGKVITKLGYLDTQIAVATSQGGYEIKDLDGNLINKVSFLEFIKILKSPNNNVRILLTIDKFKFGLNIANIISQIHLRLRAQYNLDADEKVTISIIQTFGRAVRTWYGIQGLSFYNVADAVKWLVKNYGNSKVFNELRKYMRDSNSHFLTVPDSQDNPTYLKAEGEWTGMSGRGYSTPINLSLFNMIDDVIICPRCNGEGFISNPNIKVNIDENKIDEVLGIND